MNAIMIILKIVQAVFIAVLMLSALYGDLAMSIAFGFLLLYTEMNIGEFED